MATGSSRGTEEPKSRSGTRLVRVAIATLVMTCVWLVLPWVTALEHTGIRKDRVPTSVLAEFLPTPLALAAATHRLLDAPVTDASANVLAGALAAMVLVRRDRRAMLVLAVGSAVLLAVVGVHFGTYCALSCHRTDIENAVRAWQLSCPLPSTVSYEGFEISMTVPLVYVVRYAPLGALTLLALLSRAETRRASGRAPVTV